MKEITGLSTKEASKRLKKFGFNEITTKKESVLKRLLKKLWSPIPWMIETAAVLSALIQRWEDFMIIIVLLFVNIFVDYSQESKAINALKILKRGMAKKAWVLRGDEFKEINSRYLVPGDIIKLKIGNIVPADAKLISGKYLEIDQSSLTGESFPATKKVGDEIYSGSIVRMGEMIAEVTKTGLKTFFGKNTKLVEKAEKEEKSHFEKVIIRIGNFLILFSATMAVLILLVSILKQHNLFELVQFILVLIIASIPVALPAVLSVTMAVGAVSIARHKAIVTNLSAVEELAGIDVFCSDKTGTLTENKMTIGEPILYSSFTEKDLFTYAVLASSPEKGDSIEYPILQYLENNFPNNEIGIFEQEDFIPFDPVIKKTEVTGVYKGERIIITKGAPHIIADICDNNDTKKLLIEDIKIFAQKGYRTLAVAIKSEKDTNFRCVGLIPFFDPLREDSMEVVDKIKKNGISIKMLTGDSHAIAVEISKMLKIGSNIFNISKLKFNNSLDLIEKSDGFSQVLPEDKYFIVDELQKKGHIVAMTGDGVNDAPALKKADIGIAVSRASDAARAASDVILLSPGLSVINRAIYIARETFRKMESYAIFRISETIRIILFMTVSVIVFDFYPITTVMIVLLALLNDIPVMMIAYDKVQVDNKPIRWDLREVLTVSLVLGTLGVVSSFLLFYWLQINNFPALLIQTMIFIKLDVAGHSTLYLTRTGRYHFWHKPRPSLKFFLPAFGSRIIGTLMAVYGVFMVPIGWEYAGYMWIYATIWWFFNDYIKVLTYKILDKNKKKQLLIGPSLQS